jgi:hypothetical protein
VIYGQTTTSIIHSSPVALRALPLDDGRTPERLTP